MKKEQNKILLHPKMAKCGSPALLRSLWRQHNTLSLARIDLEHDLRPFRLVGTYTVMTTSTCVY